MARHLTSPEVSLQCAAVLFDLDGVLVDSAACIERTWSRWAHDHQLDPAQVIALAHGRRAIETVQLAAPHLTADREVATLAEIESNTTDGVYQIEGAREMLLHLPPSSWAIVTSGIRDVAKLRLRHTGLPVPEVLVCADEIQRGKPDPEGYLTAARRLGVAPNACVVIEDAPAGLEAARAAGMRSIAVSGTYSREALASADYTIPSLAAMHLSAVNDGGFVEVRLVPPSGGDMATAKQKAAARRNIKKAAKAARQKKTIAKLPKKTRTALGKQGAKMARRKRRTRGANS